MALSALKDEWNEAVLSESEIVLELQLLTCSKLKSKIILDLQHYGSKYYERWVRNVKETVLSESKIILDLQRNCYKCSEI